jgi:peptidylprolyl isomerase
MAQAKSGDTVRVHYTGRLTDGREFDSSVGRDPLEFTIGSRSLIPAFEDAVIGLDIGQSETLTIPAADAYGARVDEAVQTVERSMIPPEVELAPGRVLQATAPGGQEMMLTVVDLTDDTVTLDANHPLAGEDLTFDIELVAIV